MTPGPDDKKSLEFWPFQGFLKVFNGFSRVIKGFKTLFKGFQEFFKGFRLKALGIQGFSTESP